MTPPWLEKLLKQPKKLSVADRIAAIDPTLSPADQERAAFGILLQETRQAYFRYKEDFDSKAIDEINVNRRDFGSGKFRKFGSSESDKWELIKHTKHACFPSIYERNSGSDSFSPSVDLLYFGSTESRSPENIPNKILGHLTESDRFKVIENYTEVGSPRLRNRTITYQPRTQTSAENDRPAHIDRKLNHPRGKTVRSQDGKTTFYPAHATYYVVEDTKVLGQGARSSDRGEEVGYLSFHPPENTRFMEGSREYSFCQYAELASAGDANQHTAMTVEVMEDAEMDWIYKTAPNRISIDSHRGGKQLLECLNAGLPEEYRVDLSSYPSYPTSLEGQSPPETSVTSRSGPRVSGPATRNR